MAGQVNFGQQIAQGQSRLMDTALQVSKLKQFQQQEQRSRSLQELVGSGAEITPQLLAKAGFAEEGLKLAGTTQKQQIDSEEGLINSLFGLGKLAINKGNQNLLNSIVAIGKESFPDNPLMQSLTGVTLTTEGADINVIRELKPGDPLLKQFNIEPGNYEIKTDSSTGKISSIKTKQVGLADIEVTKLISGKVDKLLTNTLFTKAKTKVDTAKTIGLLLDRIEAGDQAAIAASKTQIPRALGEVGNLTAAEQNAALQGQSLARKIKTITSLLGAGKLPQETIDELRRVFAIMQDSSKQDLNKLVGQVVKSASVLTGKDEDVRAAFAPFLEERTTKIQTKATTDLSTISTDDLFKQLGVNQ